MDKYGLYDSKEEAGKILGEQVEKLNLGSPYILAIPRGGIQMTGGIADKLRVQYIQ